MNSIGVVFRVTLFGESHGPAIGVTIDGIPPGIPVKAEASRSTSLPRPVAGGH